MLLLVVRSDTPTSTTLTQLMVSQKKKNRGILVSGVKGANAMTLGERALEQLNYSLIKNRAW